MNLAQSSDVEKLQGKILKRKMEYDKDQVVEKDKEHRRVVVDNCCSHAE